MSGEYFISDYRPTKRIGVEELDGCLRLLVEKVDAMDADGEADAAYYAGALLALECMRYGSYNYPADFVAVLENKVKAYTE